MQVHVQHNMHEQKNKTIYNRQSSRNADSSQTRPKRVVGKYFITKTLGNGSMGKVKLAIDTETKQKVAVKIVTRKLKPPTNKKERDAEISREIRTIKEASIMVLLDHPNIAKVYEMVLLDNFYYLFMEYVDGGQLLDYIISHGKLKEKHARHIARQIGSAIDYCHRNSIVHRDLKVENILISSTGDIKVIDFGLSNVFSPRSHLNTFCGSLYFAAPELLDGKTYTGPEVDVWSFAVVIYVLVCGQVPFDHPTMKGMHAKVKGGVVEYPPHLSPDCVSLLQKMLVVQRKNRATMTEVIAHSWMNKGYEIPVENNVPTRKPLELPIDMKVVRGMQGFEFGTEQEIKAELEALISSEEYQRSAKAIEKLSSQTYDASQNLFRRKSFSLAMSDPQSMPAAYHPLISIYYLVKERMEREDALHINQPNFEITEDCITNVDDSQHPLSNNNEEDSIGIAFTPEGKINIPHPTQQQEQAIMKSALESEFSPKISIDYDHDASITISSEPSPTASTKKDNVFRRFGRRFSRQHNELPPPISISNSAYRQQSQNQKSAREPPVVQINGSPIESKDDPPIKIKRSTSITIRELPSTLQQHEEIRMDRRKSAATTTTEKNANRDPSLLLNIPKEPPMVNKDDGRADDKVKSVFVKGLFSVSTTSSKKPSAIREELIRVLSKLNIDCQETKGRFECWKTDKANISSDTDYSDEEVKNITDPNALHFDICIVKIPWLLGMRGIQFRRISGDPWRYKNSCSKILEHLKL